MFKFVVFAAFVACVAAMDSDTETEDVWYQSSDVRPDGFDHKVFTKSNIAQSASGDEHGNIKGEFQFLSAEGDNIELKYVADENGYQPVSAWLPTPPPVPEYILRSIEYIRTHSPRAVL